jgi:hypothetical protein
MKELFFNFVMLLKWQSSIRIFSQIWQYSKYESRKIFSTLDGVGSCGDFWHRYEETIGSSRKTTSFLSFEITKTLQFFDSKVFKKNWNWDRWWFYDSEIFKKLDPIRTNHHNSSSLNSLKIQIIAK